MIPIPDDQILGLKDAVLPTLHLAVAAGRIASIRGALVDMGGQYAALREVALGHADAVDTCREVAQHWLQGQRVTLPIRGVGDDELLELEAGALGRILTADEGGLLDLGRQARQRFQAGATWPSARRAAGAWLVQWYGGENPWTPPGPIHPDPIAGQLRYGDRAFADDNGPRNVCGQHFGDLIGQAIAFGVDAVRPALEAAAAAGAHVIRSWINVEPHPWWSDKPVPSWTLLSDPMRVREVLALGAELGLRWHLASGGLAGLSDAQEDTLFDGLADAISDVGPTCIALVEACNEVYGTGDRDDQTPTELARLLERVRRVHPGLLYALTAAAGASEDRAEIARWTLPSMRHYYYHPERGGHLWDKLRHGFSMGYSGEAPTVRWLGWAGECWGNGRLVSVTTHKDELDGGAMALGAAMAAMSRQAWCQMGYGSVVLTDDDDVVEGPGFALAPAVVRALPRDLAQFRVLGHGGESQRGQRIWAARADVRADYALHDDGRFVALIYGPPDQRPRASALTQERAALIDVHLDHPVGQVLSGRFT